MTEIPETHSNSTELPQTNDRVGEVINELRRHLTIPSDDRSPDWQSSVGDLISAICSDFAKREEDEIALTEIALVSYAAQKGSKEAKKRALKPIRWATITPTSISDTFPDVEEAKSAIRVLHTLQADWTEQYICIELAKNRWPTLSMPLVDWLLKTSQSIEVFVKALKSEAEKLKSPDTKWILQALENATKLIGKNPVSAGIDLMSEIAELILILDNLEKLNADSKSESGAQNAKSVVLALINEVSATDPSVLVQGAAPAAFSRICFKNSTNKTVFGLEAELLCRRTISMISALLPNADQAVQTHYKNIWISCRNISLTADQLMNNAARENPALNSIISTNKDQLEPEDLSVTAGLEGELCELMVNWDDYFPLHKEDPAVQQLAARIDELGLQLGVMRFGNVGDEISYDPIRHYLSDSMSSPPSKVIIRKPGISLARNDGSSRVLLMAVVSPT